MGVRGVAQMRMGRSPAADRRDSSQLGSVRIDRLGRTQEVAGSSPG